MDKIIEIEGLTKRFPGVVALRNINMEVEKGIILGLLGPNGSGKSTLLKLLVGLLKPSKGKVRVFGEKPTWKLRERIAYVPEVEEIYRWMKVEELISFVSSFYSNWQKGKERELIDFLGIERGKRISELSRGMRMRLKILLALARRADLVLLDEPLSGIDPVSRQRIIETLLREFKVGEKTVIFSTHIVREAERIFDKVVFLREGEIYLSGDADRLREERKNSIEEIFREIFGGAK